jgi:hypothetical protein
LERWPAVTAEEEAFATRFEHEEEQFKKDTRPQEGAFAWSGTCWLPIEPMNPLVWLPKPVDLNYGDEDFPPPPHRREPNEAEMRMIDAVLLAVVHDENWAEKNRNNHHRKLIYKNGLPGVGKTFMSLFERCYSRGIWENPECREAIVCAIEFIDGFNLKTKDEHMTLRDFLEKRIVSRQNIEKVPYLISTITQDKQRKKIKLNPVHSAKGKASLYHLQDLETMWETMLTLRPDWGTYTKK